MEATDKQTPGGTEEEEEEEEGEGIKWERMVVHSKCVTGSN